MLDSKAPAFWDLVVDSLGFSANMDRNTDTGVGAVPLNLGQLWVVAVRRRSVKRSNSMTLRSQIVFVPWGCWRKS